MNVTLVGENTLTSTGSYAGLQKTSIDNTLFIQGGGELKATGGYNAAGIGGTGAGGNAKNITILSGTVTATGGNGAGIGGGGYYGSGHGGDGENITISGGTVTAIGNGGAGIGGGQNGDGNNITISGGTVTATSVGGAGIGGGAGTESIYGNANNIKISGGKVFAQSTGNGAGIGSGTTSQMRGPYALANEIEISGGEVTAIGNFYAGIGSVGTNDGLIDTNTVDIRGTDETHCPIVYTNNIKSINYDKMEETPENGGYWGIVFEGNMQGDEFMKGIVYGNGKTVDLSEREEAYTLGAGKILTVLDNVTFKPSNKFELNGASDTEKSVLYLKTDANLEYWYEMTKNEYGEIQHEHSSTYGWYYSDEEELYNGAELIDPALWDEVKHLYINDDTDREGIVLCNICGKPEPHPYDITADWQQSTTHHWHEGACNLGNDCAVTLFTKPITSCSYTSDGKLDNGKHKYNFEDVPEYKDGKWIFKCTVCEYETPMEIPVISLFKVDGENNPLAGAEFGLYSDAACTTLLTSATSAKNGNKATAVFGSDFGGGNYIKPGNTYYIKETKAPEGYTLSDKVFAVSIAIVDGEGKATYGTSDEPPVCENIANVPDEPEDPENPEDPKDPENPDDPKPSNPTPDNPTPNDPTPDNPTPDNPTPDDPTPDPDDNDNPNTGVGFGIAGLMLLGGSLCVVGVSKRRRK